MKLIPIAIATTLALGLAACDRPGTKTSSAPVSGSTTSVTTTTTTMPANPAQTADTTTPSTPATSTAATTVPSSTDTSASTAATGSGSTNAVADTLVTGKVKTAITTDNGMKDSDISVKTENGVVTLTGNVKSPEQVTLAAALAQRQEGVSRVENQVTVK